MRMQLSIFLLIWGENVFFVLQQEKGIWDNPGAEKIVVIK